MSQQELYQHNIRCPFCQSLCCIYCLCFGSLWNSDVFSWGVPDRLSKSNVLNSLGMLLNLFLGYQLVEKIIFASQRWCKDGAQIWFWGSSDRRADPAKEEKVSLFSSSSACSVGFADLFFKERIMLSYFGNATLLEPGTFGSLMNISSASMWRLKVLTYL